MSPYKMADQLTPGPYDAFQVSLLPKALANIYNDEATCEEILD